MNIKRIWKTFNRHRHSFRHGTTHCNFRKIIIRVTCHTRWYLLKKSIKLERQKSWYIFISYKPKTKIDFQQVSGLLTRNSELRSTSKPCRIKQTFVKEFSYMLFLLYYSLWFHSRHTNYITIAFLICRKFNNGNLNEFKRWPFLEKLLYKALVCSVV